MEFLLSVNKDFFSPISIEVSIFSEQNEPVANITNQDDGLEVSHFSVGECIPLKCIMKNINLTPGKYYITLYIGTGHEIFDWIKYCMCFYVEQGLNFISRSIVYPTNYSMVLQSKWQLI